MWNAGEREGREVSSLSTGFLTWTTELVVELFTEIGKFGRKAIMDVGRQCLVLVLTKSEMCVGYPNRDFQRELDRT